ncbi:hypothetical protein D3C72_918450 [compost metagenome]
MAGGLGAELGVAVDAPLAGVDNQALARAELAFFNHARRGQIQHAGFRAEHDQPVARQDVARGAQAVAVQPRAREPAVGEGHGGRAVPWLHQAGVVVVEAAQFWVGVRAEGLGHQHHERMHQRAARARQQLEGVVERARVAAAGLDDRAQLGEVRLGPAAAGEIRLAGAHPVAVAGDGIDLAVVRHHPKRLGQWPGGEGVGAVALMEHANGRLEGRVSQVRVEVRQLVGHHQALVNDGPRRERTDIKRVEPSFGGLPLHRLARDEQPALEGGPVQGAGPLHEHLAHDGHRGAGLGAEHVRLDRHVAPGEGAEPPSGQGGLGDRLGPTPGAGLGRQEDHADRQIAHRKRREARRQRPDQQPVGQLSQHAGAVAAAAVGGDGPAVRQVRDGGEAHGQDVVAAAAVHVGHEAHATGVMLESGVVQPGGAGPMGVQHAGSLSTGGGSRLMVRRARSASDRATRRRVHHNRHWWWIPRRTPLPAGPTLT